MHQPNVLADAFKRYVAGKAVGRHRRLLAGSALQRGWKARRSGKCAVLTAPVANAAELNPSARLRCGCSARKMPQSLPEPPAWAVFWLTPLI